MLDSIVESFADTVGSLIEDRVGDINVAIVARVESYDNVHQRAVVQPLIRRAHIDENGRRVAVVLPKIHEVPVVFPGGGGFRLTFPLSNGDTVLCVFSQASLDKLMNNGGIVDPDDDRRHDLTDAIAIPTMRDFKHPWKRAPSDRATLGMDEGAQIDMLDAEIQVGGTSRLVTKGEFDAFVGKYNNHLHSGVTTGGGSSGPPQITDLASNATGTAVLRGFIVMALAFVMAAFAIGVIVGGAR